MAKHNQTVPDEVLLDVRVAEASWLYKFYLKNERRILGGSAVVLFFFVWELVGNTFELINPLFMSAPSLVLKAGWEYFVSGEVWPDLYASGMAFFWGFGLSVVVGIPFGIITGWYKRAFYITEPFVVSIYVTPNVALLPLIVIWLGIGLASKVALVFLIAVFPILINTRDGVKTTPQSLINASRSFGATQSQIFRTVVLPSTVPFILSGLRLGLGRGLIGVFVGELYAATAGVGFMITVSGATFQTDRVFVGIMIFAVAGLIAWNLLGKVEARFNKWRPRVGAAE